MTVVALLLVVSLRVVAGAVEAQAGYGERDPVRGNGLSPGD